MPATEHQHGFDVFGTRARVIVRAAQDAPLAALRVHALLRHMHQTLTRFDAGSELSRLNARAGETVAVSSTLLNAVQAALWAARRSDGLVDPTVIDALERHGYAGSRAGVAPAPLRAAVAAAPPRRAALARPAHAWAGVEIDVAAGTIRLPPGVRIDLGGSAKGLAVDRAAELLAPFPAFAVDAGGDLRIGGRDRVSRLVEVAHPLEQRIAHRFSVTSGAVATSGLRTRTWRSGAGYAHHLIDPARGTPAWTGVIQATALAPTALEAETLAKLALLRGPHAAPEILAAHGGALFLDDGELILAGALAAPQELVA
jgi:thiamine biosynthesis lipoprotein